MPNSLTVSDDGPTRVLTVSRPPANYFDAELLAAIADAYHEASADRSCRVVVLCSGVKHFCAGVDFGTSSMRGSDRDTEAAKIYDQVPRLFADGVPMIAAVNGAAIGGGMGLACAADFRVGSTQSRFQAAFASLGFHHGFALTLTLPRIVGHQRAQEMLLTARSVDGARAHATGLLDRLVDAGAELDGALALAHEIASNAPLAVRAIRSTLRRGDAAALEDVVGMELAEQMRLWKSRDSEIGLAAMAGRQRPAFTGE